MVVNTVVFETRGGALLGELEPADLSWEVQSNTAETVEATFQLEGTSDLRSLLSELNHCLAVDVHGRLYGGPILPHRFDDDAGTVKVTARGFGLLTEKRSILPLEALTKPLSPGGMPDTSLDTVVTGVDHGTIMKRIVQQACTWPGWDDIPITFEPDRPGFRTETYAAVDRKKVWEALTDLAGQEQGPDFRFRLERLTSDSFGWLFETGTEDQPRLQAPSVQTWEPDQGGALEVVTDPSRMGSVAWSSAGRSDDVTLVEMEFDPRLIDAGYPLLELETDASQNISDPETLRKWNRETLRTAWRPWEFWKFRVPAELAPRCGDLCDVVITRSTVVSGGYIEPRDAAYRRRVVGLSGGLSDEWVTVTCGEVYDQ